MFPFIEQWNWQALILWWVILPVAFFLLWKLGMRRYMKKLENGVKELEKIAADARNIPVENAKEIGKPEIDPEPLVRGIVDFFLIRPVDLDPRGILQKLQLLLDTTEDRFKEAARQIAPEASGDAQANLVMTLKGAAGVHQIAKIARHYLEMVKKTNNFQAMLLLQNFMPQFKKISKGYFAGTKAMSEGRPIGDGVGAIVAAYLIGDNETKEIAEDVVAAETELEKRKVIVLKAKGPGGRMGKLGDGVEKLVEENKDVKRIVTVDAVLKMEGEETGSVAEGVGVALGDPGPQKSRIEEIATKNKISMDAVGIKLAIEEAIQPMKKEVVDAVDTAISAIKRAVQRAPEGSAIIVVGVGNSCGVGDSRAAAEQIEIKEEKEKKEKSR